ncbi:hypothetical protein BGX27_008853 [Mortierella sp. AM989]|nr:hypothetical protein BGX27_008853 [Mortierella sp. AM989]
MSTKPCGNCNKTVYLNEKITAESRWYHRGCFRCMAPDCNIALTLRNFQMAALDDSVIDPLTKRPRKVLVCKEHVPMPKSSINADSLEFKHTTSVPKPSIPGLHRSMMGERGLEHHEDVVGSNTDGINSPRSLNQGSHADTLRGMSGFHSPRSLDQGSHAEALKGFNGSQKKNELEEKEGAEDEWATEKQEESLGKEKQPESPIVTMRTTTVPMFRNGRLGTVTDPVVVSHVAAAEAQSPTKDDDSFRNIPVRPSDYGHQEGHAAKGQGEKEDSDDWSDPEDEDDKDFKRPRVFGMKGGDSTFASSSKIEENLEKKLGEITFGSKLARGHEPTESTNTVADNEKTVDDDEWDTVPADDFSRRETAAI